MNCLFLKLLRVEVSKGNKKNEQEKKGSLIFESKSEIVAKIFSKVFVGKMVSTLFIAFGIFKVVSGSGGVILLVFEDEILDVGFGFGEFRDIETFVDVVVQESLALELGGELFDNTLKDLLHRSGVGQESSRARDVSRSDSADGALDVVGNPIDEGSRVFLLEGRHLVVNFVCAD